MTTTPDRHRDRTRPVRIRDVVIGGGAPVAVQSMNTTDTRDVAATRAQIASLAECGCEIARVAVPDHEAAEALRAICRNSPIPVVADIHFDYRLALESIRNGAHKIRINPGNIGGPDRVREVAAAAKERGIPIRVGVNSGSLNQRMLDKYHGVNENSMVESALENIRMLEACGFEDIVVSLKASDPLLMIESYRLLAGRIAYPLHLGVTEAGTPYEGSIRSAVGIGTLLAEGIGDTIRVSLTGMPDEEVRAAYAILKALRLRVHGPEMISCPTCGRTQVDLIGTASQVEQRLRATNRNIRVAVMGCAVNGPGEAREADIGIAGGKGEFLLFSKGRILRKVSEKDAVDELFREIERLGESGS
ncbi:MAG: flavodoxin-dependent (E)-4-hydroxy-3-methylbut-2-enyl-diphosphate synthase [Clostridia bacterium]|nr:flavodoxin-dependent (E)-4-hydroxy-3-methylbut-2-enyl-diphosphate synthase [Clostridia bacterium]